MRFLANVVVLASQFSFNQVGGILPHQRQWNPLEHRSDRKT